MATDVSNFTRITIPRNLLQSGSVVRQAVDELTAYVGGVSRTESIGEWYDGPDVFYDVNYIFQWNFPASKFPRADALGRRVVDAMFRMGEQAVFKERNYNSGGASRGYRARIIHAPVEQPAHIEMRDPTSRGSSLHTSNHLN